MAKIGTYPIDGAIAGGDKLIGTDVADGSTKNFTVSDLTDYIGEQVPAKTLMEVTAAGNTSSGDVIIQGEVTADSAIIDGSLVAAIIQSNGSISASSISSLGGVSGTSATFTGTISTTGSLRFTGTLNIGGGNNKFTFDGNTVEQGGFTFNGRTQIKTELVNISSVKSYGGQTDAQAAGLIKGDIYYNTSKEALSIVL